MKRLLAPLLAALLLAPVCLVSSPALAADALRLALQKTGTASWEIAVIKAFGLDHDAGLTLETTELATPEAGKIAIKGPATTCMACEEGRMAFEAAFTKAFGAATVVRFEGNHMYLESPGVPALKFHLRELQGG